MAKSTSERQITHIKDVFPESSSLNKAASNGHSSEAGRDRPKNVIYNSIQQTKCDEEKPKRIQALNGDVFFKSRASETGMSNSDDRVVVGPAHVRAPPSKKKRPAPKPPDTKRSEGDTKTSEEPGEENQQSTRSNTEVKGSQPDTGQQLGSSVVTTGQHNTTFDNDAVQHIKPANTHTTSVEIHTETSLLPISASGSSVTDSKSVTSSLQNGGDTDSMDTNGRTFFQAPHDTDPDNVTSAASCLSDSGTASSSSGYASEDVPDHHRLAAMTEYRSRRSDPLAEEDEAFGEDECTLDFDDEDDIVQPLGNHTTLYKEYQGEDFARYLQDDNDLGTDNHLPLAPPRGNRQRRKRDAQPQVSSASSNSSTMDTGKKKGIKQRFSQMFTLSKQHKTKHPESARNGSIQNFSFADSKMGVVLGNASDIDNSTDYKIPDTGLADSWWNTDTLSARSLRNHSQVKVRQQRANSVPDMLDNDYTNHRSTRSDLDTSQRSRMYDSKGRSSGKKFWSKFTRNGKKKEKVNQENFYDPVVNDRTLTNGHPDVRL